MNVETWNVGSFVVFVLAFALGMLSTAVRVFNLWRAGIPRPILIWRDVMVTGGIALSFLLISWHRAVEMPFADMLWWFVLSSLPALLGGLTYLYFDLFIIGHGFRDAFGRWLSRPQRELPKTTDDEDQHL